MPNRFPSGLSSDACTIFVLVFHEIVTNAAKYGALSDPAGRVNLRWTAGDGMFRLKWSEMGGPAVQAPSDSGFGSFLIEEAIKHQLDGVTTTLSIPTNHLTKLPKVGTSSSADEEAAEADTNSGNAFKSALVLDDNFIVAVETRSALFKAGFRNVVVAHNNEKALAAIETAAPDCAVLDLNPGG